MFLDYLLIVLLIYSDKEKKNGLNLLYIFFFYEVWMVVIDCRLYKLFFRKELCKKLYKNV